MDALSLRASLVSQRDAARWYASARHMTATGRGAEIERDLYLQYAREDQQIAAKLSLADRTFRGLEG